MWRSAPIVSVLDSGSSGQGLSPGCGHCIVFMGKTRYSHSASLQPEVHTMEYWQIVGATLTECWGISLGDGGWGDRGKGIEEWGIRGWGKRRMGDTGVGDTGVGDTGMGG